MSFNFEAGGIISIEDKTLNTNIDYSFITFAESIWPHTHGWSLEEKLEDYDY